MNNKITLIVCIGLLIACQKADRDPVEPLLPQYSELGLNSAGGVFNGEDAWFDMCTVGVFYNDCQYLGVLYDTMNTSTIIKIAGELYGTEQNVTVGFQLNNLVIQSEEDLKALEGTVINLDGVSGEGILNLNNEDTEKGILVCEHGQIQYKGQLHIRKVASHINYEGKPYVIFSGTFGFDLTSSCWAYSVYQGRFDYLISSFHPI